MSEQSEIEAAKVKLRANGDLTVSEDGAIVVVAHYDKKTGTLEFATSERADKLRGQCVDRISTVSGGTQPSGNVIRALTIKGMKSDIPKNAPKRPKMGPLGDSAEDIAEWYLTYNLPEAIVRYGIYVDEKGNPVRKKVRRKVVNIVDRRDEGDEDLVEHKQGKTATKGPVAMEGELQEVSNAVIARRATALTFTPSEVVGGWQPDDDYEAAPVQVEDES